MVSYLQFKSLTGSSISSTHPPARTGYPAISLHTCSIQPIPESCQFHFLPLKDSKNPVPFPESMLFLCNPGTSVRTTQTRPCLVSLQAHRTGSRCRQHDGLCIPHAFGLQAVLLGARPAGFPATPECHSSNSSLYEPSRVERERGGTVTLKRLARLSKGHGLLPSWRNTGFSLGSTSSQVMPRTTSSETRWDTTFKITDNF